ncbi:MAG TPA: IclR family transcriptional regulator [Microbacterium sp.]|uniref:IclR family transcriptional regulator n=1 Tax=Microbacterium sp. TaxID=51671 RepID=UPI002C0A13CD|nr:IclR family transcriptional regulator [Microbacterium sp.]HWI31703.1 IclR family transcriptional regulator [Microbacterium sp.]
MSILGRAATILNIIAEGRGRLTLTDLSNRSGLPRSTVHRIVQELEREYFVIRHARAGGYFLGPGVLKFGMNSHLALVAGMRPSLISLAQAVNENVELALFSGREVIVVDQVVSTARMQAVTKIGKSFSLHGSCIGKALLARLPVSKVRDVLPPTLQPHTPHTITDVDAFLEELDRVRQTGIAFDREEHDLGISAVAAIVAGVVGVDHAVAIVAPTERFDGRVRLFVERLKALQAKAESRADRHDRARPTG